MRAAVAGADVHARMAEQRADLFIGIVAHVFREEMRVEFFFNRQIDHRFDRRRISHRRDLSQRLADITSGSRRVFDLTQTQDRPQRIIARRLPRRAWRGAPDR